MRVAWVHPSWRDLVIEDLAARPAARRAFLQHAELPGVLLALSVGGGEAGARELPLLSEDADWDALADTVHRLARAVDDRTAGDLLAALQSALAHTADAQAAGELRAVAEVALETTRRHWDAAQRALDVDALERWWELHTALNHHGRGPQTTPTWDALAVDAPLPPDDPQAFDRVADWLHLLGILIRHDPEFPEAEDWPQALLDNLHAIHTDALRALERVGTSRLVLRGERQLRWVVVRLWAVAPWLRGGMGEDLLAIIEAAVQSATPPVAGHSLSGPEVPTARVDRILRDL